MNNCTVVIKITVSSYDYILQGCYKTTLPVVVSALTALTSWEAALHRCSLLLQMSHSVVCVCVEHMGELCKNGWTDQDAISGM